MCEKKKEGYIMSYEKAKEHLKKYGLEERIIDFSASSATVKEAACALSCTEGEIAKSLSFLVDDKPILIVVAGDAKVDNSKYKQEFHKKAKMIPFDKVEEMIGHAAGGVCPFGIKNGIDVYLDQSLQKYAVVYPACGNDRSAVKLALKELEEASCYQKWVDVCKEESLVK